MAKAGKDKEKAIYFMNGKVLKIGGLAQLLGCSEPSARMIATEAEGFPPKRVFARGIEGWSRAEIDAWFENPTAPPVGENISRAV